MMKKRILLSMAVLLSVIGASAQDAATLPDADELHIISTEEKVPTGSNDSYMRIALDRKVEADKWTLIVFPAVLDGYYFGVGAERYKVTEYDLTTTPVTVKREKMSDGDDFQANQMYLVKSKAALEQIVAMSPGVKTKVAATPDGVTLMCLTLSDEPTAVEKVSGFEFQVSGDSRKFDLGGRLSKSVSSGIYIINGKKVFAK